MCVWVWAQVWVSVQSNTIFTIICFEELLDEDMKTNVHCRSSLYFYKTIKYKKPWCWYEDCVYFLLLHVKGYILLLHDVNTINIHIQTICCTFTGCSPEAKARQCCEFVKRLSFNSWCSSCYDTNINRLWWLSRYRYCAGNVSCCILKQLW